MNLNVLILRVRVVDLNIKKKRLLDFAAPLRSADKNTTISSIKRIPLMIFFINLLLNLYGPVFNILQEDYIFSLIMVIPLILILGFIPILVNKIDKLKINPRVGV